MGFACGCLYIGRVWIFLGSRLREADPQWKETFRSPFWASQKKPNCQKNDRAFSCPRFGHVINAGLLHFLRVKPEAEGKLKGGGLASLCPISFVVLCVLWGVKGVFFCPQFVFRSPRSGAIIHEKIADLFSICSYRL